MFTGKQRKKYSTAIEKLSTFFIEPLDNLFFFLAQRENRKREWN